jgi:UPF0755 protein
MHKIIKLFIWIQIVIVAIGIALMVDYKKFVSEPITSQEKIIEIESWDTFKSIGNKIEWINQRWLKLYLKQNPPVFELHVWTYRVPANSNLEQIIESLKTPIIEEVKITLLEWWNIYDIDEHLFKKWLIQEKNDYISYVNNSEKIQKLSEFFPFIKWVESLEWFLYPDTYSTKIDFHINLFVIQQLENFEKKVYKKLLQEKWYSNETIYDVITLASIVEKEEKSLKNKATVAGILKKRLNEWWMIGADITVCYPHKLTSEECKLVVTKYINQKNEYNTRTMVWLPKTPIGNPSYETVNATLNDKKTPYYYYLHDIKNGNIYYGRTNAEHERNKGLYLR